MPAMKASKGSMLQLSNVRPANNLFGTFLGLQMPSAFLPSSSCAYRCQCPPISELSARFIFPDFLFGKFYFVSFGALMSNVAE